MMLNETCQLCTTPATRDAKLKIGPWAYVCESHFKSDCHQIKGLSSIINKDELDKQTKQLEKRSDNGQT